MISALLFSIFLLGLSLLLLFKFRDSLEIKMSWLIGSLLLKLIAAAFLGWLYTEHYSDRSSADIYKYFDDAAAIEKACAEGQVSKWDFFNPWLKQSSGHDEALSQTQHWDLKQVYLINDNRTMSRIHLLLLPASNGHFWVHQLFFTMLAFWGCIMTYLFFKSYLPKKKRLLFILLLLFPSILLWTSGALKESYLFFAMGGFLLTAQKCISHGKVQLLPLLLLFTFLMLTIKIYVAFVLLPLIIGAFLLKKLGIQNFGFNALLDMISVVVIGLIFSGEQILHKFQNKLADFTELAINNEAGSYFEIPYYQNLVDLLLYTPFALYNVLFRPIFPSSFTMFSAIAAFEHLALAVMLLFAFIYRQKVQAESKQLACLCLAILLPMVILIGSTVPVLGAVVRYKVVFLPFYLALLLTFVDLGKLPFLKKIK